MEHLRQWLFETQLHTQVGLSIHWLFTTALSLQKWWSASKLLEPWRIGCLQRAFIWQFHASTTGVPNFSLRAPFDMTALKRLATLFHPNLRTRSCSQPLDTNSCLWTNSCAYWTAKWIVYFALPYKRRDQWLHWNTFLNACARNNFHSKRPDDCPLPTMELSK